MGPNLAALVSSAPTGATPTAWPGRAPTRNSKDFYLTERLLTSLKGSGGAGLTKSDCVISSCTAVNNLFCMADLDIYSIYI